MKSKLLFEDLLKKDNVKILEKKENIIIDFKNNYSQYADKLFFSVMENCGGIIIDNWIRLYGCGQLNVIEKNKKYNKNDVVDIILGEDVIGGLFALKDGIIYYFAPDTLRWENLNIYYTNYIDWLIALPWKVSTIDNYNLKEIKDSLDKSHYGLDEVKERIVEYIAIKNHTTDVNTPIICLVGPPGTGKTSIAKSIAKAINKKFVKISVGGINDEGEIKGHRRTYIGANPGKIIQGLKKAKVNNPLFLIDEIDKMTSNYKGDPASSLLDVLDKEQNNMFMDNYIEEEFDLSKVMFILTANNLENIPAPLRDRLEIIELSSYTNYEKVEIAKNYLIPRLS